MTNSEQRDANTSPNSDSDARQLAEQYGLVSASMVPSLKNYLISTWRHKDFIAELADARSTQQYSDSLLGRIWQLITPLLNAAIYYLIFGILLGTRKGIENFTAFLVAGVFVFNFMQVTVTAASASIPKNSRLIQAVHFPKLVLPLATVVQQIQQYLVSLTVLLVIILATGEPLTLMWLTLPLVLAMQILFTTGFALIVARWGARSRDISQLLPFFTHAWRYVSGVFFSIAIFTAAMPDAVGTALTLNPGAVYIDLVRDSLMASESSDPLIWIMGAVWAIVFFVFGLVYFYRGERKYVN
jgi:teichoic acid transport system permease protein